MDEKTLLDEAIERMGERPDLLEAWLLSLMNVYSIYRDPGSRLLARHAFQPVRVGDPLPASIAGGDDFEYPGMRIRRALRTRPRPLPERIGLLVAGLEALRDGDIDSMDAVVEAFETPAASGPADSEAAPDPAPTPAAAEPPRESDVIPASAAPGDSPTSATLLFDPGELDPGSTKTFSVFDGLSFHIGRFVDEEDDEVWDLWLTRDSDSAVVADFPPRTPPEGPWGTFHAKVDDVVRSVTVASKTASPPFDS